MHYSLLALAASLASTSATYTGFNYGSTFTDGSYKAQSDFEAEFKTAQGLVGTSGKFTSARLYTTIQGGTTNTPTGAIPAGIATQTTLLLGLWASGGQTGITNEIAALQAAISQYGSSFADLVAAISVGSEDLYRNSPTGIENMSGIGAQPEELVDYISQVRNAIKGTALEGKMVGHVDTWTAWVNGSNSAVAAACDFVGMDAYPYFQTTEANSITNGKSDFFSAYDATQAAADGKPVWITETGWPVSGPTANQAVPSIENAETYWDQVACSVIGNINTWWFTLQDAEPTTPSPSFGLIGSSLTTTPLYNLTCPANSGNVPTSPSSSSGSSGSSSSTSAGSGTATSTASTAGSTSGSTTSGGSSSGGSSSGSSSSGSSSSGSSSSAGSSPGSSPVTASGSAAPYPTPSAGVSTASPSIATYDSTGAAAPAATAGVMMGVVALAAGLAL